MKQTTFVIPHSWLDNWCHSSWVSCLSAADIHPSSSCKLSTLMKRQYQKECTWLEPGRASDAPSPPEHPPQTHYTQNILVLRSDHQLIRIKMSPNPVIYPTQWAHPCPLILSSVQHNVHTAVPQSCYIQHKGQTDVFQSCQFTEWPTCVVKHHLNKLNINQISV